MLQSTQARRAAFLAILAVCTGVSARSAEAQNDRPCFATGYIGAKMNNPFSGRYVTSSPAAKPDGTETKLVELVARDSKARIRVEKHAYVGPAASVTAPVDGQMVTTTRDALGTRISITDCPGGNTILIEPATRTARILHRDTRPFEEIPYRSSVSTFLNRNDPNYIVEDLGDRDFQGISAHGLKLTQIGTEQDGEWSGKPILIQEQWVSQDIGAMLLEVRSDLKKDILSRAELMDIKRDEPDPSLFEIPNDYKIVPMQANSIHSSQTPH